MSNPQAAQLPAHVIRCMSAQDRAALGLDVARTGADKGKTPKSTVEAPRRLPANRQPNKTEAEYQRMFLQGVDAHYEGITFRMNNLHKYTPDFVYADEYGIVCVECKGAYVLPSHRSARLAFDQCRVEWPTIRFVWATREKSGNWKVEK